MELKYHTSTIGSVSISIPYYEIVGKQDGPTLFISGGIHGNEVNGVYVVHEILRWIGRENIEAMLAGRLLVFPVLNPTGFAHKRRTVFEDGKDLNRQFGVGEPATISQKIAFDLVEYFLTKSFMGIDFHDAGEGAVLIPHARIHRSDEDDCVSCSRNLARVFGSDYLLERDGLKSMMAVHMNNKHNVPVITVEVGGAQNLYPGGVDFAVNGLKNLLMANRMIPGSMQLPAKQYLIFKRFGVKSRNAAVVQFNKKLGDRVEAGERLGMMYVPETQIEELIVAPKKGVIFSIWPDNQVAANRTIYTIVDFECEDKAAEGIEEMENFQVSEIVN